MQGNKTRGLLLAGFGGLLLLLAFTGLDTIRVLRTIQKRNDGIRGEFLNRNRVLNQIRADLYVSGTYVRDYLMEPEPGKVESHRISLEGARAAMETALGQYGKSLREGERRPFANLEGELTKYWKVLEPAMGWRPEERQKRAFGFLRDEVQPRRAAMLGLADEIGLLNEQQLHAGNQQVAELFSDFELRLGSTMVIALALGLLVATYSMSRILKLERQAAKQLEETLETRGELKRLSARLVEAQETERRAISRELHDEVGQSLSALMVGLTNLAASARGDEAAGLAEQIEELKKVAGRSVGVVRNMTLLLRPSMLDDLGLIPALQWQVREVSKRSGMVINFVSDEAVDEIGEEQKTAVYRVVQEALHNCEKHSGAKEVRITLRVQKEELLLSIQDDGKGFDPRMEKGVGIRGMQERIENLGGIFNVESTAGRGALLTVRLPLGSGREVAAMVNGHEGN